MIRGRSAQNLNGAPPAGKPRGGAPGFQLGDQLSFEARSEKNYASKPYQVGNSDQSTRASYERDLY